MRKALWIILTMLLVAIGAPNASARTAEEISFTGVVTCNDTTPCGGSSTFTVTGTYIYDPTTETLGAFSFVTPIGTIASSLNSCTVAAPFEGTFDLAFVADQPGCGGSPSDSTYIGLGFSSGNTSGVGSIVVPPGDQIASSVCQLASNGGCPTLSTPDFFPFVSGTSTLVPAPEPGTAALWFTGIALMIVMRKRVAQLLRLDTGMHHSLFLQR
jgi:hypothetical protein